MTATVDQKGRTITIVGVGPKWDPDAVKPLGGRVAVLKGHLSGTFPNTRTKREVILEFKTTKAAAAAFGALFFDTACGLADAMPDSTEWTCDETRRATRTMK